VEVAGPRWKGWRFAQIWRSFRLAQGAGRFSETTVCFRMLGDSGAREFRPVSLAQCGI